MTSLDEAHTRQFLAYLDERIRHKVEERDKLRALGHVDLAHHITLIDGEIAEVKVILKEFCRLLKG